jgi:hypothetical protein
MKVKATEAKEDKSALKNQNTSNDRHNEQAAKPNHHTNQRSAAKQRSGDETDHGDETASHPSHGTVQSKVAAVNDGSDRDETRPKPNAHTAYKKKSHPTEGTGGIQSNPTMG